jgi:hypothetical protein
MRHARRLQLAGSISHWAMLQEEKEDNSASRKLSLGFISLKLTLAGSLHVHVDRSKNKLSARGDHESRASSTTCGKYFPLGRAAGPIIAAVKPRKDLSIIAFSIDGF